MVAAGRNVLIVALLALAGCRGILGIDDGVVVDGGGSDDAEPGPDAPPSPYRKLLTFRSPVALPSFVLPVIRGPDPDLAARALPDGSDVRFTQNGQLLPYEMVRFDGMTGAFEAWVSLPVLLQDANTMYLEYGGLPIAHDATAAWPAFVTGSWHLSEADLSRDSTTHVHALSAVNVSTVAGIGGAGADFEGNGDRISAGDPADGSLDLGTRSASISLWVNVTTSLGLYDKVLDKGGGSAGEPGYTMELGTQNWSFNIADGQKYASTAFGLENTFLGRWVQLAAVIDREMQQVRVYVDGQQMDTNNLSGIGSINSTTPLVFSSQTYPFRGRLDEMRIYADVRSTAWFVAERAFLTQLDLVEVGPEE